MTAAPLPVREAYWRKRVQLYRRNERRLRAQAMDLQRRWHELPEGNPDRPSHQAVDDAKRRLRDARTDTERATAALAKVRQDIAGGTAPRLVTSEEIGLGFTYPFGFKGPVFKGAGHYTAGHRAANREALIAEMRADHRYHASKGWGGLSYEAMIADDGTVGLGNPMNRKSAAVANQNTGLVSVCCPGTTGDRIVAAQLKSVEWLLANWHTAKIPSAHRLPRPARDFEWRPHKRFPGQATACPGAMEPDYLSLTVYF